MKEEIMSHLRITVVSVGLVTSLILLGLLLTGCGGSTSAIIEEIGEPEVVEPSPPVAPGTEVSLKIGVTSSAPVSYRWEPDGRGDEIISGETSSAIIWRAPQKSGLYNVRVKVTINGKITEKSVAIRVVKIIDLDIPAATATPVLTHTLTPTSTLLLTLTPNLTPTALLSAPVPATATTSLTPQALSPNDTSLVTANVISTPTPTATPVPVTNTPLPSPTPPPPPPPPLTYTPTASPSPTSTPTATSTNTPVPVDCGPPTDRGCLAFISPQLEQFSSASPFVFSDKSDRCRVEYTGENIHSEPVALKIVFETDPPNYCGWGIGQLPGFDVSGFGQVSFYLKGTIIGQKFEFKIKDIDFVEDTQVVTVSSTEWTKVSFALDKNNFPTVNLKSLENINLGFNDGLRSAEIYVDDFTFE
jgi:hypothetical protein